ncbi:MAG: GNAT family N-acetyltransferase [Verrucomicrobiales bacterium]|nr:GNAT family N-acetyltransferase [Verrucomicrobiales bacterium]
MKLLFSETRSDYGRYVYPYVIWAIPEAGETAADCYERGFLPASPELGAFYLCRNLRVNLGEFSLTSENRRILRKNPGLEGRLIPRAEFDYTPERRGAWRTFADERFGVGVMPFERLDRLMNGAVISHLLSFVETETGGEVGNALLYVEAPRVAHYYYAFYDLGWRDRSLGLWMMTWAVRHFAGLGFRHLHLGTCYSRRALYKTQFRGTEFFNGNCWGTNIEELKFLLAREEQSPSDRHLLDNPAYLAWFYEEELARLVERSEFRLTPAPHPRGGAAIEE